MIHEYKNGDSLWIDVVSPTKDEVVGLMERFHLDPFLAEDLMTPGIKSKIDYYRDYIFMALSFPSQRTSPTESSSQEIDFVLGKNFLITVRYDFIEAFEIFSKLFEVDSVLKRSSITHAGAIFYHLLTRLYDATFHQLESMQDSLQHIEMRIFKGEEKKVVRELLVLSSDLIHFKQTIGSHEETLSSFKIAAGKLFDEEYSFYVNGIVAAYQKIYREIRNKREFLFELRETNDSLLNTKQNENMRVFTMLAFFTFPLSLVVAIFALPTTWRPIIGMPYDFVIIMGILVVILSLMILYFKDKKWL